MNEAIDKEAHIRDAVTNLANEFARKIPIAYPKKLPFRKRDRLERKRRNERERSRLHLIIMVPMGCAEICMAIAQPIPHVFPPPFDKGDPPKKPAIVNEGTQTWAFPYGCSNNPLSIRPVECMSDEEWKAISDRLNAKISAKK